jgi:Bacterial Ig domain
MSTIIGFAACTTGGGSGVDPNGDPHVLNYYDSIAPVVEIYTPAADQVFTSGSAINMTGKITDETGLYRGSVRVTNDANGELLKEQLYEIHGFLTYNFTVNYTTSVTTPSNYTVTVNFEDHGLNASSRSVKVKVNP